MIIASGLVGEKHQVFSSLENCRALNENIKIWFHYNICLILKYSFLFWNQNASWSACMCIIVAVLFFSRRGFIKLITCLKSLYNILNKIKEVQHTIFQGIEDIWVRNTANYNCQTWCIFRLFQHQLLKDEKM